MYRKKSYKDLEKFAETKRNYQRRYSERTGSHLYKPRVWTQEENEMVLAQNMTDRELSKILERSLHAIQTHRWLLRKGEVNED